MLSLYPYNKKNHESRVPIKIHMSESEPKRHESESLKSRFESSQYQLSNVEAMALTANRTIAIRALFFQLPSAYA